MLNRFFPVAFLLAVVGLACGDVLPDPAGSEAHVVVIGVDGLSPDGIRTAETPHLDALMEGGAFSLRARGVFPTSSSPNWASMIMGAGPEQHGITTNAWELYNYEIEPTGTGVGPVFPTIFDVLDEQRPEAVKASIYDWGGFGRLYNREAVDIDIDADGPETAAREAVRVFGESQPAFTFVHLDHVDHAGHAEGHGSEEYYAAVEEADRLIGEILDGLDAAGMRDQTTVIVTADHGGVGTGHGGESMAELEIPWIVNGPGVAAGTEIADPIDTYDTAATVAYLFGLDMPEAWIARPVYAAFGAEPPEAEATGVAGVSHVVVLGVDGMSPDGIQKAHTPVFNRMLPEAAYSFHARGVLPTSSSQNWASMIMGAGSEQHGITSNDWERDRFTVEPTAKGPEGLFPNIFSELRAARPDARIAVIYDWGGFGRLYPSSVADLDADADGPADAIRRAVDAFAAEQPTLTFIHLDHVDHAGHEYGHGSDEYYASVEETDRLLGDLLDGLAAAGMADETLLIITSDHGGKGTSHGGESMGELEIPWIAYGAGVAAGTALEGPIDTYDTAATVLYALGVPQPAVWIGRPVRAAFGPPAREPAAYVPAPRITPLGRLYVDEQPTVTLGVDDPQATIRYTLDGSEPTAQAEAYAGPFRVERSAQVRARAFRDGVGGPEAMATYRLAGSDASRGVTYRYYEAPPGQTWNAVPDFTDLIPVRSGRAIEIDVRHVRPRREDQFAVVFEGTVEIPADGTYIFHTTSDDGSLLYIDGEEVVDNDGGHGARRRSGRVDLTAGTHAIRVTYFDEGGGEHLEVFYQSEDLERQIVPSDVLRPAG